MKGIILIAVGILIAVALFVIYPNIFYTIVHYVQLGFDYMSNWFASRNVTNATNNASMMETKWKGLFYIKF